MPFAGYKDFDECVRKNSKKDNPKGYCAVIQRKVEGPRRGGRMREAAADEEQLSDRDLAALSLELKMVGDPMRPTETP
jgi:hypothetical protein